MLKDEFEKWAKVNRSDLEFELADDDVCTYLWADTEYAFATFKAGALIGIRQVLEKSEETFFDTMEGIRTGIIPPVDGESTIRQSLKAALSMDKFL